MLADVSGLLTDEISKICTALVKTSLYIFALDARRRLSTWPLLLAASATYVDVVVRVMVKVAASRRVVHLAKIVV